jgi:hypothetical protein
MLETNDGFARSARNCLNLLDRIFEKFCFPRNTPALPIAPLTDDEMDRLTERGMVRRGKPRAATVRKVRSVFSRTKPQGGKPVNPAMVRAVKELAALERTGKKRRGDGKRIAAKHGVRYHSLMERMSTERNLARRKAA